MRHGEALVSEKDSLESEVAELSRRKTAALTARAAALEALASHLEVEVDVHASHSGYLRGVLGWDKGSSSFRNTPEAYEAVLASLKKVEHAAEAHRHAVTVHDATRAKWEEAGTRVQYLRSLLNEAEAAEQKLFGEVELAYTACARTHVNLVSVKRQSGLPEAIGDTELDRSVVPTLKDNMSYFAKAYDAYEATREREDNCVARSKETHDSLVAALAQADRRQKVADKLEAYANVERSRESLRESLRAEKIRLSSLKESVSLLEEDKRGEQDVQHAQYLCVCSERS